MTGSAMWGRRTVTLSLMAIGLTTAAPATIAGSNDTGALWGGVGMEIRSQAAVALERMEQDVMRGVRQRQDALSMSAFEAPADDSRPFPGLDGEIAAQGRQALAAMRAEAQPLNREIRHELDDLVMRVNIANTSAEAADEEATRQGGLFDDASVGTVWWEYILPRALR